MGQCHEDDVVYDGLHVTQDKQTFDVHADLEEYCNNIHEVKIDKH